MHLANSLVWRGIAGEHPPTTPPTAAEYTRAGLPWFEYYDESRAAIDGGGVLQWLKSVARLGREKGDVPLPENQPVSPENLVIYRRGGRVREGAF